LRRTSALSRSPPTSSVGKRTRRRRRRGRLEGLERLLRMVTDLRTSCTALINLSSSPLASSPRLHLQISMVRRYNLSEPRKASAGVPYKYTSSDSSVAGSSASFPLFSSLPTNYRSHRPCLHGFDGLLWSGNVDSVRPRLSAKKSTEASAFPRRIPRGGRDSPTVLVGFRAGRGWASSSPSPPSWVPSLSA
jgi:hypothetical protein